jgi:CheY-like chemotaxis protein
VATSVVYVDGDAARLEQIVTNLLDNAVKYTPAGGAISVAVSPFRDSAVIRVRDSGIGIAPELLPRMFDLFTQGERSLDRATGGLGLGLAVVKQLVTLHGGRVFAASAGAGAGSEFVVELPAAQGPVVQTAVAEGIEPPGCFASSSSKIMTMRGRAYGCSSLPSVIRSKWPADGPEGLEILRTWRPDVAFVDVGLPGLDGYAVARAAAADPEIGAIPLVALTGYGQPEDRRQATAAGFRAHLVKPVFQEALLRTLAAVTKRESSPD